MENNKMCSLLLDFIDGELPLEQIESFEEHFLECDACFCDFHFILDLEELIKKHATSIFPNLS